MNLFQEVKEAVTTIEAASFYGIEVNRNRMAKCPFHADHTPSMRLDRRYHCFGCGEDGDVINFVAKLFGLNQYDAAIKLVNDMGIMISEENKPGNRKKRTRDEKEEEIIEIRRQNRARVNKAREKQFQDAVERVRYVYCDYFRLLNQWEKTYFPKSSEEEPHPLFLEAIYRKDHVEHLLEILDFGSAEDKALVLIDKAKEVDQIEKWIKEIKTGDGTCSSHGPPFCSRRNDG